MKVRVDTITEDGFSQKEEVAAGLWDMDSSDLKFIDQIGLNCEFKRLGDEILVKAQISFCMEVCCSRCLDIFRRDSTKEIYLAYNSKGLEQFLDVDKGLREEILLDWPMKFLCRDNCKGICPGCGRSLNSEECSCRENANKVLRLRRIS